MQLIYFLIFFISLNHSCLCFPLDIYIYPRVNPNVHNGSNFHPYGFDQEWQLYIKGFLFKPFFSVHPDGNLYCSICQQGKTEEISTNAHKKLEFDFTIANNLFWGDGVPVTVGDVKFSLDVADKVSIYKKVKSLNDFIIKIVENKKNDKNMRFVLKKSIIINKILEGFVLIPRHIEEAVWIAAKKNPLSYLKKTNYRKKSNDPGLYYGHYSLSEIGKSKISFVKNKYNDSSNNIDSIDLFFINQKTLIDRLISGKKNFIFPEVSRGMEKFITKVRSNKDISDKYKIVEGESCIYDHLILNHKNPVLLNSKVRKSLYHALDRDHIYEKIISHKVLPATSFIHPNSYSFYPKVVFYEYNPSKAEKLLVDAGWIIDENTAYRKKNGKTLNLSVLVNNREQQNVRIAKYVAKLWKAIGIKSNIIAVGEDKYRMLMTSRNFTGVALASIDMSHIKDLSILFSQKSIPSVINNYMGLNLSSWYNIKVEESVRKLRYENNSTESYKLISRLQLEYTNDLPAIPLFFRMRRAITSMNIEGYQLNNRDQFSSSDVNQWHSSGL